MRKIKINFKGAKEKLEWMCHWIILILYVVLFITDAIIKYFPGFANNIKKIIPNANFENGIPVLSDIFLSLLILVIYTKVLDISNKPKLKVANFEKAMEEVFQNQTSFKNVRIFAYSAKNYIAFIKKSAHKINKLELLLRRSSDYEAWLSHEDFMIKKYKSELQDVLDEITQLKKSGKVKKINIRFYDFEAYTHFAIFDNRYAIVGNLIHKRDITKMEIDTLQVFGTTLDYGMGKTMIDSYSRFFDNLCDTSSNVDSGLKIQSDECATCKLITRIVNEKAHGIFSLNDNTPNWSVLPDINTLTDFLIIPDSRPISPIHLLIVPQYHILSLYELLRHKRACKYMERFIDIIDDCLCEKYKKHIIMFEHGSAEEESTFSAKTMMHLHLHIIINYGFNYIEKIREDNKVNDSVVDTDKDELHFKNFEVFRDSEKLASKDYFLIYDPKAKEKITVYFPRKQESQYLRRIFYECLSEDKKAKLGYDDIKKNDSYDWKMHGDAMITESKRYEYEKLGAELEKLLKSDEELTLLQRG